MFFGIRGLGGFNWWLPGWETMLLIHLAQSNRGGLLVLWSFSPNEPLHPPTPAFSTSLFTSFSPFLIVWGSCSNSINSHSLWWLVPVHRWPGGRTVVCRSRASAAASDGADWRCEKLASGAGRLWLYTLTAGRFLIIKKLHTHWKWERSHALSTEPETRRVLFIKQKYNNLLIINRRGLVSW